MRNSFALVLVMFIGTSFGNAQGIVNTERMLTNAGDSLTLSLEIAGDLSLGNVSLLQVDTQLSSGIRKGNHLYRALFGYDFLRSDGSTLSADLFHQFRYNYFVNRHSLYGFYQIQNAKALKLKNRQLAGGGFRFNLYQKKKEYVDVALGGFYESEIYNDPNASNNRTAVQQFRVNVNVFNRLMLTQRTQFLTTLYYQVSAENTKDARLFLESTIRYTLGKSAFFVMYRDRYHSTPYIAGIEKADQKILFGFSFDL
ncbi:MAG: DUF481 domain-containing protein [bacterium]|nr:DUF481 domain-containing protein [bacterium]